MKTIRLTMVQALVRFLDNQYLEVDGENWLNLFVVCSGSSVMETF